MTYHHLPPRDELIKLSKVVRVAIIAKMYNVSIETVYNHLNKEMQTREKLIFPTIAELKANINVPDTRRNQIYRMYFVDKIPGTQLADRFGVSRQRIFQILESHPEYKDSKIFGINLPSNEILFDLYFVKMMTKQKIARQYKISTPRIAAALEKLPNYKAAMRFRHLKTLHKPHKGIPSTIELFRLYTEEGLNTVDLAKKFNVVQSHIYAHISKHPQWNMVRKHGPNKGK